MDQSTGRPAGRDGRVPGVRHAVTCDRYVVTHDIADDRRRAAVYKCLRGFGDHLQYSAFRCDLIPRRGVELIAAPYELIEHATDQIPVIDLGPVDGWAAVCVSSVGRAYINPERPGVCDGAHAGNRIADDDEARRAARAGRSFA